jgi:excisionase family DNA binding protein
MMIVIMATIEILTPDEVSELLRLSPNRVVLLARRGEIPFLTIDGRLRFDARDVEDWLRSQRSDSPTMPPRVINNEAGN